MTTRRDILQMLAEGQIDVATATELLGALREGAAEPSEPEERAIAPEPVEVKSKNGPRWLHIQVSDLASGRQRVRVNVPLGMVNFGLKLGARFTDEVDSQMVRDVMDALRDHTMSGTLVEVENVDENERVHIFID